MFGLLLPLVNKDLSVRDKLTTSDSLPCSGCGEGKSCLQGMPNVNSSEEISEGFQAMRILRKRSKIRVLQDQRPEQECEYNDRNQQQFGKWWLMNNPCSKQGSCCINPNVVVGSSNWENMSRSFMMLVWGFMLHEPVGHPYDSPSSWPFQTCN